MDVKSTPIWILVDSDGFIFVPSASGVDAGMAFQNGAEYRHTTISMMKRKGYKAVAATITIKETGEYPNPTTTEE